MTLTYAVVVEQYPRNCGAYAPGRISAADSQGEMLAMIRGALTFHIEATAEHGDCLPPATATPFTERRWRSR